MTGACNKPYASSPRITVTYIDKENKDHTVQAPIGKNLLEVAHDNEVDLEGGSMCWIGCFAWVMVVDDGRA